MKKDNLVPRHGLNPRNDMLQKCLMQNPYWICRHECNHMMVQIKTSCNASVFYEDANANVCTCNASVFYEDANINVCTCNASVLHENANANVCASDVYACDAWICPQHGYKGVNATK